MQEFVKVSVFVACVLIIAPFLGGVISYLVLGSIFFAIGYGAVKLFITSYEYFHRPRKMKV